MSTFNITKKNRKYFAATKDGYKCKILIDSNSEGLEIGEHTLFVDDISVRSKYGTDLIFKLSASIDAQESAGICSLKTNTYNQDLVDQCRDLGGKWDKEERVWIFPGFVSDKIEVLDEKYNSAPVSVELTITNGLYGDCGPVYIAGFQIARAFDRDSGAKLADGVALMSGSITSGGSRKKWNTVVSKGSVIRLTLPSGCIADIDTNEVAVALL